MSGANWQRTRAGLPQMSATMLAVMQALRDARGREQARLVENVHGRTIWALVERDWIGTVDAWDGPRYYLTGRGLKALKVYERPLRRSDNLCPMCEQEPRLPGRGYCRACYRKSQLKQYHLKGHQFDPDAPCSRCHEKPRRVRSTGEVEAYCADCRRVMRAEERRRKHERKLARMIAGEVIRCCKCDQPVYHTDHTVYDYCYQHYREQQNTYLRRRGIERALQAVQS